MPDMTRKLILPNGKEIEDSYFMVNKISIDLRKLNIIPIFIGGSQDLTSSIYKSFEKNNQWINITSVDNRFDFSKNEKLISGDSYMSSIIMHKPSYLFSYTNIGYQSYLNSQEEIDLIEKLFFDCYRLGDVLDNIKVTEPVFRESDIVTFDLKCLSAILTGAIWGKPIWGTYWAWDPRLTSFSILLMFSVLNLYFLSILNTGNSL